MSPLHIDLDPGRNVPSVRPEESIGGVASDGSSIIVVQQLRTTPVTVSRLDLTTGRREFVKNIAPADLAGVFQIKVFFTPDYKSYAYAV